MSHVANSDESKYDDDYGDMCHVANSKTRTMTMTMVIHKRLARLL